MTKPSATSTGLRDINWLAAELGWSVKTAYREYRRIGVPFVFVGKSLRFLPASVRGWIASKEQIEGGTAA
jgi:hypothetical protein